MSLMGASREFLRRLHAVLSREVKARPVAGENALIYLTYRCTSRCKTCTIWKRKPPSGQEELDWRAWQGVLDDLINSGVKNIEIFGGDALLRKDIIFDFISYCRLHGIDIYFATNGNLLDKETADSLIKAGLHTIYFSIDDLGSGHDEIRGIKGAISRVIQALEFVLEAKGDSAFPNVVTITTLSSLNSDNLYKILRFLDRYSLDTIKLRRLAEFRPEKIETSGVGGILPTPFFMTSDGSSHLPNLRQANWILSAVKQLIKHQVQFRNEVDYWDFLGYSVDQLASGSYGIHRCLMAAIMPTISPFGDVTPCPFYDGYILGNVLEKPFRQIWNNRAHRAFLRDQFNGKLDVCDNCILHRTYCNLNEFFSIYSGFLRQKF